MFVCLFWSRYDRLSDYELARSYKPVAGKSGKSQTRSTTPAPPTASSSNSFAATAAANASNLHGLYVVPSTVAEKQRATAEALRTTLVGAPGSGGCQLIGQPYNDEHLVEQYIRQEIVDFR
jgi:hypothetical protein